MKRRSFLTGMGVLAGGAAGSMPLAAVASAENKAKNKKPVLTLAHITDVHIREGDQAPERFKNCLRKIIAEYKPDLFLNGGDSIHDASYDDVKRERVTQLWSIWDECILAIKNYDLYSCIGNHDPWWQAPSSGDPMYGKDYVVQRLKIPGRYYHFLKEHWHFIILDGNNQPISLDQTQFNWLKSELEKIPPSSPTLIMSHYPILGTTQLLVGGGHTDFKALKDLFYAHRDKVKICLSGHNHLSDKTWYDGVLYCCNGAMSGYWWGQGDKDSAGPGYYMETPPGYAILKLYEDGTVENDYFPHGF